MKSFFLRYILLCFILLILTEAIKDILNINFLIYNSLAEKFSSSQINSIINLQKKWEWVGYVFFPIYVLLKIFIIGSVLYIGTFFFVKTQITFKKTVEIVINAEFIFLLIPILKIVWFYFFQSHYTLEDLQYFYPLSALTVVGYQGIEPWLIYPLQVLNLFEVAYILYLSYQIGFITKTDNGLKIVCSSYVPALLLWIVVIMFFTLNNS